MKTKLVTIILTCSILIGCKQKVQEETTTLGYGTPYVFIPEFMKGKVKEVKETIYWVKDENGKPTKSTLITWKELDSIQFSHNFLAKFDEKGLIVGCDYLYEDGTIHDNWSSTSENGKLVKVSNFLKDSLINYIKYKYDKKDHMVEAEYYRPTVDTLLGKWVIGNNREGQYIKIEFFNYKNAFRNRNEITRREDGRVIERKYYNKSDSMIVKEVLTYNNDNVFASQEIFTRGKSSGKYTMDYTFESKGNWETALVKRNGKPYLIVERSYMYY